MSSSRPRRSAAQKAKVTIDVIDNESDDYAEAPKVTDSSNEAFSDPEDAPSACTLARRPASRPTSRTVTPRTRGSNRGSRRPPAMDMPLTPVVSKMQIDKELYSAAVAATSTTTTAKVKVGRGDKGDPNIMEAYPSQLTNRNYHGPLRLRRRIGFVLERFFGPRPEDIKAAASFINYWYQYDEAPIIRRDFRPAWLPEGFAEKATERLEEWRGREIVALQRELLDVEGFPGLRPQEKGVIVVMDGKETRLQGGQAQWVERTETAKEGWMIYMGGTVLDMSWAIKIVNGKQALAVCVVPFTETDGKMGTDGVSNGVVQILTFTDLRSAAKQCLPTIRKLKLPWGYSRKIKWCPENMNKGLGLLAVLSMEGEVHVLEIDEADGYSTQITRIATLSLITDSTIKTTCFAWTTPTRLTLGHSDGTISLWSIAPLTLLSRHPTHHSTIVDITTGYPSCPMLTVSVPLAGLPTLQDLSTPSTETTSWALPSIAMQCTALQWHDDLQGFFINHPSSSPLDASVSFMHVRYFPHGPAVVTGSSAISAFSIGSVHPFFLVGFRDGTVHLANAIKKVFAARSERPQKRKLMQHEFRPVKLWPREQQRGDPGVRGATRVISMNVAELNERKDDNRKEGEEDEEGEGVVMGPAFRSVDPARTMNHEKGTRVACIRWNPVLEAGTWASVAMASGLLFVSEYAAREDE